MIIIKKPNSRHAEFERSLDADLIALTVPDYTLIPHLQLDVRYQLTDVLNEAILGAIEDLTYPTLTVKVETIVKEVLEE
jgi:hypothetical protein